LSASQRLVEHALGLEWDAIPETARAATRFFLLDSLAVGAAGRNAAHADMLLAMVQSWGQGGDASVLGRPGVRLPAASAAFLNGFQIHGQEFDCVHEPAVLHPMATVLAALLAEMERGAPVTGTEFLTAIVAGVDVAVTLGVAAGPLSFFRPATAGIFGSVAAIARLRRLDLQIARDAFGHALAFASGTMQAHVEGKPALPVQVANAARNALVATDLARGGMSGVLQPIEGPFGFANLLERSCDIDAALARLTTGHAIVDVSCKPFPTGRAAHGGIVAVTALVRDHGVTSGNIVMLNYHAPPLIHRLVGRPVIPDMEPGYARLCLSWLAAVTLTRGVVGLADFSQAALADPEILELAERITVVAEPNSDPAAFVPGFAIARLQDGTERRVDITHQLGAPDAALNTAQHRDKVIACLAFAKLDCSADSLLATIETIELSEDVVTTLRGTGIF
jgi:2-methylcitrate dehydratase PrpD